MRIFAAGRRLHNGGSSNYAWNNADSTCGGPTSAWSAYYCAANAETLAAFGGSLSIGAVRISRTKVSSGMYWFVAITNAPCGRWIAARKTASLNFDFSIPRCCLGADDCQVK
jgi:hypothetical protein